MAEFQDSLTTTAAVETGASISDLQTPIDNEPDESVETDSGPPVDSQNQGTGPGPERRSPIYAPRPTYPIQARLNNWEGAALLEVRIGRTTGATSNGFAIFGLPITRPDS